MQPIQGMIYTVRDIATLDLKDVAFLRVPVPALGDIIGGRNQTTIQVPDDGTRFEDLFPDVKFEYIRETHEWIPIFDFVGDLEDAQQFLEYELLLDPYDEQPHWHAFPKGHPREQYYRWHESDPTWLISTSGELHEAPDELIAARDYLAALSV